MQLRDLHRGSAPAPLLAFKLLLAPQVVNRLLASSTGSGSTSGGSTSGSAIFASASLASYLIISTESAILEDLGTWDMM